MAGREIVTVGLTPVWDRTCYVDGIAWGEHKRMRATTLAASGKSLNVSKALAWMGVGSTAAGLWGKADWADMTAAMAEYAGRIRTAFTAVEGRTRENVTVVDERNRREMHLRSTETLVTAAALERLRGDLAGVLGPENTVVFSGSLPAGAMGRACISLIAEAGRRCAELVVDTSGEALGEIVKLGGVGVIKPNLEELGELVGRPVEGDARAAIAAARPLCERVGVVLVSLGREGAAAVTRERAVWCRAGGEAKEAVHTVGCGDYLLAGFVAAAGADLGERLAAGVRAATAKAWGWAGERSWEAVRGEIAVEVME